MLTLKVNLSYQRDNRDQYIVLIWLEELLLNKKDNESLTKGSSSNENEVTQDEWQTTSSMSIKYHKMCSDTGKLYLMQFKRCLARDLN